MIAFGDTERIG